jgi:hypothetical protein
MSDFKPRPGTFLPFMESGNRENAPQRGPASPLTVLEILARQPQQSLPIFDLQSLSGLEPSRYGEALQSLLSAGYIAIEGNAPQQAVKLTASGLQVVQLARPA